MQEVIIRDSRGVCPYCSGLLTVITHGISYRCIDCKTIFTAIGKGYSEYSVVMRKEANDNDVCNVRQTITE